MRLIDFFYVVAFAVLMGWLVLGSVIDAEHSGGLGFDGVTTASPLADGAPPAQPHPVATATVDERDFWIFVGGSPKLYSVAIGEGDEATSPPSE